MSFQFTRQQNKVLNTRGHNVLVSAAAGSGKTAVLVERIIRMISEGEEPLDIDRLLVVTFTRAAAAQMRERIGEAISKRLEERPQDRHLQRQETLLHHAQITTIDSFCTFLLRNNFSEIDLDPGFRQMDETEALLLKGDVLRRYLEEVYDRTARDGDTGGASAGADASEERPDETEERDRDGAAPVPGAADFRACVDYFCPGGSDTALEELISGLYRAADSHPYPQVWLEERKGDYDIADAAALTGCDWYQVLLEERLESLREIYLQYQALLRMAGEPGGPYPWLEMLRREKEGLFGRWEEKGVLPAGGAAPDCHIEPDWLRRELVRTAGFSFSRIPRIRKEDDGLIDQEQRSRVRKLRDRMKDRVRALGEEIDEEPEVTVAHMRAASGPLHTLIDLTLGYRQAYMLAKRERGVIDFSDLEHFALQILIDRAGDGTLTLRRTAQSYRAYYAEVLIDEYQDSNEVQELLLSALTGEPGAGFVNADGHYARFMVGDVKQSIYRFRNARPEIFQRKFDTYQPDDPVTERIDLDQNFRSRREVLDAANGVCGMIMTRRIGGVEYDDSVSLKPGAVYPAAAEGEDGTDPYRTELLIVECTAQSGEGTENDREGGQQEREQAKERDADPAPEDEIEMLSDSRKEALAVAGRIRQLVGVLPVTDDVTKQVRPARYSDIVILLRATSGRQDAFREIFEKEGIPLYMEFKGGYFAAEEVRQVLQLLRVIDNPRQDIPLYGVLRGYFGGFSQDEIGLLRALCTDRDALLYDCLLTAAGGETGITGQTPAAAAASSGNGAGDPEEKARTAVTPLLRARCRDFLEKLAHYRRISLSAPIHELIGQLIRDTGYEDYVRALPAGQRRAANLHSLLVKASAFEQTSSSGLFRFLRYIDRMHEFDVDYGEAGVLDEHGDVVRLTTIHKSKGLEFPICFVCGLGSRHTYVRDLSGTLLTDPGLGVGIPYVDTRLRCSLPTLRQKAVSGRIERAALGEELRVLYVAMTRAKEKLILTGTVKNAGRFLRDIEDEMTAMEPGSAHLPDSMILARNGFLPLITKSLFALRAMGREPVQMQTVRVTDLLIARLEDQETLGFLQRTLRDMEDRDPGQLPDPGLARRLEERFAYRYPHENLTGLYTKTTVSELKRAAFEGRPLPGGDGASAGESFRELYPDREYVDFTVPYQKEDQGDAQERQDARGAVGGVIGVEADDTLPVPRFAVKETDAATGAALTGVARGSAVHRMCELIDYLEWPEPSAVSARQFTEKVDRLLAAGTVTADMAFVLRAETFLPFLRSAVAARMAAAAGKGTLRREQPFLLGISAQRLNPDFPDDETILIQGIIDAFFIEEDDAGKGRHIVIVDYKTDRVKTGHELAARYHLQLEYYAEALEKMLGLPVTEKLLYSFALGREVRL